MANVQMGRITKVLESFFLKALIPCHHYHKYWKCYTKKFKNYAVGKCLNPTQRGILHYNKCLRFREQWGVDPILMELDLSSMDAHCHVLLMRAEWQFFIACFRRHQAIARFLREVQDMFTRNKGSYIDMFKLVLEGMRMSGDMWTALGNVTVMIAMFWAFVARNPTLARTDLLNDGDDMNIYVHPDDVPYVRKNLVAFFLECGHELKLIERSDWRDIEWCQAKLVRVRVNQDTAKGRAYSDEYCSGDIVPVFVRNPTKIFTTLGSTIHMWMRPETGAEYVAGVLHATGACFGAVPGFKNLTQISKRGPLNGKLLSSRVKYGLLEASRKHAHIECEHTLVDMVHAWSIPAAVLQSSDLENAAVTMESIRSDIEHAQNHTAKLTVM
jgi:hypothetical protein